MADGALHAQQEVDYTFKVRHGICSRPAAAGCALGHGACQCPPAAEPPQWRPLRVAGFVSGAVGRSHMCLPLLLQILLVGDSGVGKSSLLLRFATGGFEELVPTIGAPRAASLSSPAWMGLQPAVAPATFHMPIATVAVPHLSSKGQTCVGQAIAP